MLGGGLVFVGPWRNHGNPVKNWPWYYNKQFNYRLQSPPGWLIEESGWSKKEGRIIHLVSANDQQEWGKNAAICAEEKEGICEPEMPAGGIFVEVIDKPENLDLETWFAKETDGTSIINKREFDAGVLKGIKAEFSGLYEEFTVFFAQPSYILKITQYFEETSELTLVAKSFQLPIN